MIALGLVPCSLQMDMSWAKRAASQRNVILWS